MLKDDIRKVIEQSPGLKGREIIRKKILFFLITGKTIFRIVTLVGPLPNQPNSNSNLKTTNGWIAILLRTRLCRQVRQ